MESNIPVAKAIAIGEDRRIRFRVLDKNKQPVDSFDGWECDFVILQSQDVNGDIDDLIAAALIAKSETNGITYLEPPYIDVQVDSTDSLAYEAMNYYYELWRTNAGATYRLAFGIFPLLN